MHFFPTTRALLAMLGSSLFLCQQVAAQTPTDPASGEPFRLLDLHQDVACSGEKTGSILLMPMGGTAPFAFRWSDGLSADTRSQLAAGTYRVTATDATGATSALAVSIAQPPAPLRLTEKHRNLAQNGASDGHIDLASNGGTGKVSYVWENGWLSEDRQNLSAGLYAVTAVDEVGCKASLSVQLTEPLALFAMQQNVRCFGEKSGSAVLMATGGKGPATFRWSDGSTADTRTGLAAGQYAVTATDATGQTATASLTLEQPASAVAISETHQDPTNADAPDGLIRLSAQGGTGALGFLWDNGHLSANRDGLAAGDYAVTATDQSGCTASLALRLEQPQPMMASAKTPDAAGDDMLASAEPTQHRGRADVVEPVILSGFSPNQDDEHDKFTIEGLEKFKSRELMVFNSQGNQIYHHANYDNSWDGSTDGQPLPEGVYFYMLDLGEGQVMSGYVAING